MAFKQEYGSTISAHTAFMGVLWGPVINLIIFLMFYSYRKIWWYVHAIIGFLIVVFTAATIIPIYQTSGIVSSSSAQSKKNLYAH